MKTRVLFLNQSLQTGGIETIIRDFALSLPQSDFEPQVAVFEDGGHLLAALKNQAIKVHVLDKREGLDPRLILRLRRLLVDQRIQVLHTHNYAAWLYGVMSTIGLSGVEVVHTEHSKVGHHWRRRILEYVLSRVTPKIVAVSDDVAQGLIRQIGVPSERVRVIRNGVNTERYRHDPIRRQKYRDSFGISADSMVFGTLARLVPVKNHALLIDAFAEILPHMPGATLILAGDGPERRALEQQVRRLQLAEEKVKFIGNTTEPEGFLNALDIYAISSLSEGMNLTILEAMASGLPVVATNVGGNPQVVSHQESGFLVNSGDIDAMAQALTALACSADLRKRYGERGRQIVEMSFSQARTLDEYIELYRPARP